MIEYNVDSKLISTRDADTLTCLLTLPRVITVNKFDEDSARDFRNDFAEALNTKQDVVPIVIDSYGEQVHSLFSMIDTINTSPVPVATIVTGKAMSCGAVLMTCGTDGMRFVSKHSTVMIHDVSAGTWGKVEDMKLSVKEFARLGKLLIGMIEKNIGKSPGYINDILEKKNRGDWYLTPKQCVKHNLANKVGMPKLTVSIKTEMSFV